MRKDGTVPKQRPKTTTAPTPRPASPHHELAILELVARGAPLAKTLDLIARMVEEQGDGVLASILLLDADGRLQLGAAPSLPADYNAAIEGAAIGPVAGSCGTAAYTGRTVVTPDIATDPLWVDYRDVALAAGLAASWSTPLFAADGAVVGTLAQYYRSPQDPTPHDMWLVDAARHLATIAIERHQADQARHAAQRELELRVATRTAELKHTVEALEAEIAERGRMQQMLIERERVFSEAQRLAHLGHWVWNMRTNELHWSDELYRIYGLDPRAFPATFEAFLERIHPDDRARIAATVQASARTHEPFSFQERIVRPDGEIRMLSSQGWVEVDAAGEAVRMAGTCLDVTAQRQADEAIRRMNVDLERRVAERTRQLEETNRELEAFSYSVSHDLRAPLRSIKGFSQILLDDHAGQLDATALHYLRRVRAASQRMDSLIDELLALSRLTRQPLRAVPVDLSALARDVAAELAAGAPERTITFAIAPDLTAEGDPQLLRAVLENLLANAVKFTARRADARIGFAQEATPCGRAFVVRDNGAGFDMAYASRLFKPFSRLHDQDDFPGNGIGLATVQRIIHRHGGRIHAEGTPGRGAAFSFTLGQPA